MYALYAFFLACFVDLALALDPALVFDVGMVVAVAVVVGINQFIGVTVRMSQGEDGETGVTTSLFSLPLYSSRCATDCQSTQDLAAK